MQVLKRSDGTAAEAVAVAIAQLEVSILTTLLPKKEKKTNTITVERSYYQCRLRI